MKEILVLDNHDSFVYNLVELLRQHSPYAFSVCRPDDLREAKATDFLALLFSPGPGMPQDVPVMQRFFEEAAMAPSLAAPCPSILGICLGYQALGLSFGAELYQLTPPLHGHSSNLVYEEAAAGDSLFSGIGEGRAVGRYHSWALKNDLPNELVALATASDDGCLMAIRHRELPFFGLQFHPESIITDQGELYLKNWLKTI